MDVVLKINGREALAVWTIPYMTSWRLSPDMLLERLTGTASRFPQAFNLGRNGKPPATTAAKFVKPQIKVNYESATNRNLTSSNYSRESTSR